MKLNAPKKLKVPGLGAGARGQGKVRPRAVTLLFFAGFVALIVLLAASFLRPADASIAQGEPAPSVTVETPIQIPEPAPLPDLNNRPPARPLDFYLAGDPFPPPPPPPVKPSAPAPRRAAPAPRLPQPNPVALFANSNDVRYIGYVGGEQSVGTFAFSGKYLVMGPGDVFPGSSIRIASLSPSKAVLSDGRFRHVIERQ